MTDETEEKRREESPAHMRSRVLAAIERGDEFTATLDDLLFMFPDADANDVAALRVAVEEFCDATHCHLWACENQFVFRPIDFQITDGRLALMMMS